MWSISSFKMEVASLDNLLHIKPVVKPNSTWRICRFHPGCWFWMRLQSILRALTSIKSLEPDEKKFVLLFLLCMFHSVGFENLVVLFRRSIRSNVSEMCVCLKQMLRSHMLIPDQHSPGSGVSVRLRGVLQPWGVLRKMTFFCHF